MYRRENKSLINSIVSSENAFEGMSPKFRANIFFENYLKVESKLMSDCKSPLRNYRFTKLAINELDKILLLFDPIIQARTKDLLYKSVNERAKIAGENKEVTDVTTNLGIEKIGDLHRRKFLKIVFNKEKMKMMLELYEKYL